MEQAWAIQLYADARRSPKQLDFVLAGIGLNNPQWSDLLDEPLQAPKTAWELLNGTARRLLWPWWRSYDDELWYLKMTQSAHATTALTARSNNFAAALIALEQDDPLKEADESKYLLGSMLGFVPKNLLAKPAAIKTQCRILITAIALKRFHLLHERYPESLSVLVPKFLSEIPIDLMDGVPLRYRLQTDGMFLLYSVGLNAKDDGGDPQTPGRSLHWTKGLDWVWPRQATVEEVETFHKTLIKKTTQK